MAPTLKQFSIPLLLFAIGFGFYARTANFGWLTSEDLAYPLNNPYLTGQATTAEGRVIQIPFLSSIKYCLTTLQYRQWIPLPLLSHKALLTLFGHDPAAHHLLNAFLHGLITALVFVLFNKLTQRPLATALGCLLLAFHPQHVQLVAWAAELKDLLAYLFATLSAIAYLHHLDTPNSQKKNHSYLFLSLILFVIALSCRFIVAGLPLMLASLHFYRSKKINWLALRPHLLISAAYLIFVGYLQYPQTPRFGIDLLPLTQRLGPLFYVPFQYLEKTVLLYPLSFYNPFPKNLPLWISLLSLAAIILISLLSWRARRSHPELPLAWFWHLAALLPVCGIITIGPNHYSDHYSYLPHFALFPCLFLLLEKLLPPKKPSLIIIAIVGLTLAIPTAYFGWKQMTPQKSTTASMSFEGFTQSNFTVCLSSAATVNQGLSTRNGTELEAPDPVTALQILTRALTNPEVKRPAEITNHADYKKILSLLKNYEFVQHLENNPQQLSQIIQSFRLISQPSS